MNLIVFLSPLSVSLLSSPLPRESLLTPPSPRLSAAIPLGLPLPSPKLCSPLCPAREGSAQSVATVEDPKAEGLFRLSLPSSISCPTEPHLPAISRSLNFRTPNGPIPFQRQGRPTCITYMPSRISVKFMFDKEKKRVAFAEVGSDFIDVLFNFLTLPLRTIVRVLDKQTGLGSLDSVYQSIEQLDDKGLRADECKKMILNHWSAAAELYEDLKIKNIHDADPRDFYVWYENDCLIKFACHYTYVPNTPCNNCGKQMEGCWFWGKEKSNKVEIFVIERTNFLITDYLQVIPTSLSSAFSLLKELKVNDLSILEEKRKEFGTKEVVNLQKRSFVSKNLLTEVCLSYISVQESVNLPLSIKEEDETNDNEAENEITVKLFLNKQTNSVIFAEVGKDFVNQLLNFLTIPLGSVFSILSDNAHILVGCISNLYSSLENMGIECFKSEICRNMLLTPKVASFYEIEKQLLDKEYKPLALAPCMHGVTQSKVLEQDPKSRNVKTNSGGAFVVDLRMFMVSDNLHIFSLSICSAVKNYETNFSIYDLVVNDVS